MAVIVVSGNGRNVGKTTLVCALIEALPEYRWTAVKISAHEHQAHQPIWKETAPGEGSDTARFLAAGAERAFLVTAAGNEVANRVAKLLGDRAPAWDWIFESNRVLDALEPDLCLAVSGPEETALKPSFARAQQRADAWLRRGARNRVLGGTPMGFEVKDLGTLPRPLRQWVRARLGCG